MSGSSPRIRGELYPSTILLSTVWDHPREYGENPVVSSCHQRATGSSPRIRGECAAFTGFADGGGIIPANTGRMPQVGIDMGGEPDHPREYGENQQCLHIELGVEGSSPRIRGESGAVFIV